MITDRSKTSSIYSMKLLGILFIDGKNICEEHMDKFYTNWGEALEKTLASVPCTGEYNGSVSRYCNDGGNWDDPDYSQCIRKSIEYLQDQSTKLLYGESVDTIFRLENLENLTKESNELRSGDLIASADVLNDIALYDKYHADRLSVDQLESFISICNDLLDERNHQSWEELENEENSVTRVIKAVSAYNSIFNEIIHGEFTISLKKKNIDFCLMLEEGIQIVRMVVIVFSTRSIIHWLLPLCWVVPVIIVEISAGVTQLEGYGNFKFCWLSLESNLIWAFIGPALLVILINVVIFVIMVHKMLTSRGIAGKTLKEKSKIGLKSICIILPLFGVTWVLGAVSVNDDLVMFQYLFAIFNSLQDNTKRTTKHQQQYICTKEESQERM